MNLNKCDCGPNEGCTTCLNPGQDPPNTVVKSCPDCMTSWTAPVHTCPECGSYAHHKFPEPPNAIQEQAAIKFELVNLHGTLYGDSAAKLAQARLVDADQIRAAAWLFNHPMSPQIRDAVAVLRDNGVDGPAFERMLRRDGA